jgi:glycosyltransferase involved in cell wall biosynthesis
MTDRVLIVIPAFNEEENLPRVLEKIREIHPSIDVIVIDDGSSDQTADLAASQGIRVIRHPFNLGYGVAIQTGIKYALRAGYEFTVLFDADGQHDPSSISSLLVPCQAGEADLVVGSRFQEPRSYAPPFFRGMGMKILAFFTRVFSGLPITDPTSGFLVLNRKAMEQFASSDFPCEYPDANNLIWIHRSGLKIKELPALMHASPRRHSMHPARKAPYYFFFMLISILVIFLRKK